MNVSRRSFVNAASASIVYKVVPSAFSLQATSANDQIGMGFIGSGIRGTELLDEFRKIPGVRPVIVADLYDGYLERAKEQTDGAIATTKDYEKVLNHPEVDAVVIATPDHWHARMTRYALDAGKHVYVEKPMTWSIEEGIDVIEAARESDRVVQVGSQYQRRPVTEKARELIASGELGKVTMIRMHTNRNSPEGAWLYEIPPDASPETCDWESFLGPAPKRPWEPERFFRWRCWWDYSGGVATDLFVHLLTQVHRVMNVKAPVSAVSQGGLFHLNDGRTVPDVLNTTYEYGEGFLVDMSVNLCNSYASTASVVMGTAGTLEMKWSELVFHPEKPASEIQAYGVNGWPKRLKEEYFLAHGYTASGRRTTPAPEAEPSRTVPLDSGPSHYEHFILSLREGTESIEGPEIGHYAAGAGHLANVAYRKRRRITWNPDTGRVLTT